MAQFVVSPHMRLHEWVADEKGFFSDAGLDYAFGEQLSSRDGTYHDLGDKVGAYQTFERGRNCDVSAACHWTVNAAAASGHGKLYAGCYSVSPCGIFVAAESDIRRPEDLAGVPVSVGYQSGSHYSTIQTLEEFLAPGDIALSFADGLLFHRLELLVDGKAPAVSLFSGPFYFAEQLGFRKVVDTSFMMASMITGDPDPGDVEKYFQALRRAQVEIDLRLETLPPPLPAGIPRALPGPDGRAPLRPRRAAGVRALYRGHVPTLAALGRRARDLSRRRPRRCLLPGLDLRRRLTPPPRMNGWRSGPAGAKLRGDRRRPGRRFQGG